MVLQSRRDCLAAIQERYRRAAKRAKTAILDEFCATCVNRHAKLTHPEA